MPELDPRVPEGTESWSLSPARAAGERRPYLLVLAGPQLGEIFPLEPGRELVLGRDPGCDVRLRDTGISRRHAGVQAGPDGARLRDLGSTNGVFVEGARVADCLLRDGQRVQMGIHTALKYCLCDDLEIGYQRRLAEGVLLDPETGVLNRRHFDDRLVSELATAFRAVRPVSLLLVEPDVAGLPGDPGGAALDALLPLIARMVKGAVRREDVLGRLSGARFGVVARETPLSSGRALAERIRAAVDQAQLVVPGAQAPLTVSVGVVGVDAIGAFAAGRTDAEALGIAERALRRARLSGGNRVETEGPLTLS